MSELTMLTVKEAHELTNLPMHTLYRLFHSAQVRGRQDGRTIFLRKASLERWVRGEPQEPETQPEPVRLPKRRQERRSDGVRV